MNSHKNPQLFYQQHVFCCINSRAPGAEKGCCASKGAQQLQSYMKKRCKDLGLEEMRVNNSGCLDRCELGPVMVIYPEGIWYRYNNEQDIDLIIEQHLIGGQVVTSLQV